MNFKTEEQEREQEQEQEDGCLTKWIMKKIRSCLQLFKNDHLIQAYHLLRTCDACTENFSSPQKIFITQFQQNHPEFQQIRVIGKQVTNLLELLNESEKWNRWSGSSKECEVSTHRDDLKGEFYFKVEGFLETGTIPAIAALMETDLYSSWMPLCSHSEVLYCISPYRRILKSIIDFVLFKRECLLLGYGDILPNGDVFLYIKNATDEDFIGFELPEPECTRIDIEGGFLLQRISGSELLDQTCVSYQTTFKEDVIIPWCQQQITLSGDQSLVPHNDLAHFPLTHSQTIFHELCNSTSCNLIQTQTDSLKKDSHHDTSPLIDSRNYISVNSSTNQILYHERVRMKACFRFNPKVDFVPDWVFNLGVKTGISALIPTLNSQARRFLPGQIHHHRILDNAIFYNEVIRRLDISRKMFSIDTSDDDSV